MTSQPLPPPVDAAAEAAGCTRSVLWPGERAPLSWTDAPRPECFVDLNLDRVVADLLDGREVYGLAPILHTRLDTRAQVLYRQAVLTDLRRRDIGSAVRRFSAAIQTVRARRLQAEKSYYVRQQQRWFLDAACVYISAVAQLHEALTTAEPASDALSELRRYLEDHVRSECFASLNDDVGRVSEAVAAIRYKVRIRGLRVDIEAYADEDDYTQSVEATFERFRQQDAKAYTFTMPDYADMDHVEASILDEVAKMHTPVFFDLASFKDRWANFADGRLMRFEREVQVYLAFLDYIAPMKAAGLVFCTPELVGPEEDISGAGLFDLALAHKLLADRAIPVGNDFELNGPERILVVSGPNQGGKTTFARAFGQAHYLASLGLQAPARVARLRLLDSLFTHFERGENNADLRGKLEDDLMRVNAMLTAASASSLIIFNEMFTSTTFRDALVLSRAIMRQLVEKQITAVWVTFLDELASDNAHTVSMVSTVDPSDPARRTFEILRRPADGLAYALSIAQKWRVTLPQLRERLSG